MILRFASVIFGSMKRNDELRKQVFELRTTGMTKADIARRVRKSRERVRQLLAESSPLAVDMKIKLRRGIDKRKID